MSTANPTFSSIGQTVAHAGPAMLASGNCPAATGAAQKTFSVGVTTLSVDICRLSLRVLHHSEAPFANLYSGMGGELVEQHLWYSEVVSHFFVIPTAVILPVPREDSFVNTAAGAVSNCYHIDLI